MRSLLLSAAVLLFLPVANAQGFDPFDNDNKVQGRALSFGYFELGSDRLNNYLDTTTSVHGSFAPYYLGVGLDNITNEGEHHDIIGGLHFIIPQKVAAGPGDSLRMRLGGWHYTMSAFAWDFIEGETVTLAIGTSLQWGNLKMRREVNGAETRYTNPFICIGGRGEFRLTLGQFMIGARATYRYDFTHSLWKRKDDMMPVLPTYKNSGLAYFGYIGWVFRGKDPDRGGNNRPASPDNSDELRSRFFRNH